MTINTNGEKIKIFLNSTELTQDSTPAPDSPVDINVITGENTITLSNSDGTEEQNYPISLSSKNLFDKNSATYRDGYFINNSGQETSSASIGYTNSFVEVEAGETYTISGTFSDETGFFRIYYYNSAKTFLSKTEALSVTTGSYTFTPVTNCKYIQFQYKVGSLNANTVQIEEGSTVTTYEAYYNIKYCKIGDYGDQIFKNTTDSVYYDNTLLENEWYLKKNIENKLLNGSEVWSLLQQKIFYRTNSGMGAIDGSCQKYSDRFIYSELGVSNAPTPSLCENDGSYPEFIFKTDGSCGATLDEWKAWLEENNVLVYYPKATPTYTHISESNYPILKGQLDNLYNNAITYEGTTNITQTNNGLPFDITYELISNTECKIRDVVYYINEFLRVNL